AATSAPFPEAIGANPSQAVNYHTLTAPQYQWKQNPSQPFTAATCCALQRLGDLTGISFTLVQRLILDAVLLSTMAKPTEVLFGREIKNGDLGG
ncbi:MAG: hypothetical protein L6R35_006388, partial [Caloplaca aegaea]